MNVKEPAIKILRRTFLTPMALGVIVLSLLLTAAFVGLVGLVEGAPLDVSSRLPAYALVMGMVFVASIVRLDSPERDGITVIVATVGLAIISFIVVALATEGVFYTLSQPDEVFTDMLVFYFASAALVCTGVVIWSLHHWRDFAAEES